jgi:hypothetical protein
MTVVVGIRLTMSSRNVATLSSALLVGAGDNHP